MKPEQRILFFADAGAEVGGGHVMRCLTLAAGLTRKGAVCAFAATPAAASVLEIFAGAQFERLPLEEGEPARLAERISGHVRDWGARGLVLDHFGFRPEDEATARGGAHRVMVLDDLKRSHLCDLVLDSNLDRTAEDYPGLDALIGPDFALVRGEFAEHRATVLGRRKMSGPVRRVQVALGLTDVGGITGRVVETILPLLDGSVLDVVVGGRSSSLAKLKAIGAGTDRMTLHIDSLKMARLTEAADLAIGAGGSSVWERCCLGLPGLIIVLADNQRDAARALGARGAALVLNASEPEFERRLAETFVSLVDAPAAIAHMSLAAAAICDGRGAERVAERFLSLL